MNKILDLNIAPVFSAITHDNQGQLLNTNGDTIAASLAIAMSEVFEVELLFIFDRDGVVRKEDTQEVVIAEMTKPLYHAMVESGEIKEGLIPKLQSGFEALSQGLSTIRMGSPEIMDGNGGTQLVRL